MHDNIWRSNACFVCVFCSGLFKFFSSCCEKGLNCFGSKEPGEGGEPPEDNPLDAAAAALALQVGCMIYQVPEQ